jgi:long-chain acyl-CoA synthetase
MRSQSRESGSVWVKIGGEGYQTRIVDGLLEVKAESAMLGYINAPTPFTADGWFKTGDAVETDGEWLKILGRVSEVVNVGGEKVYPAEVEAILQEMDGVEEATVIGEANAITGSIVVAKVKLSCAESAAMFRKRMRDFCRTRLPAYKTPQKVQLVDVSMVGSRFKKMRMGKT